MDGLCNIFARNCETRRISKTEADAFLDKYHRLGTCNSRYRYGLFVQRSTGAKEISVQPGTMIAVSTFSNARRWIKDGHKISSYEWIRYASPDNIRVTGGMGKLLQAFIDDVHPDDIMTYADPGSVDNGAAYTKLGFCDEGIVEKPGFTCRKFRFICKVPRDRRGRKV